MTTSTKTTTRKIPNPLYAAAGAGDLAYQQLRKLPEQVAQLRDRVGELRPVVTDAVSDTNLRADLDRLRDAARRNAATLVANAQIAQDRAFAVYTDLIARGEKVVGNVRTTEATLVLAPGDATVKAEVSTTATSSSPSGANSAPAAAKKTTASKK